MFSRLMQKNMCSMANAGLTKYAAGTQPFTVLVEGNIASGKTSFLNHFQAYKDKICLLAEPVEKWRNVDGENLLDLMYKEPNRWAMPFQHYVTLTMMKNHTHQTDKPIKVMERSVFSSRYVFVENMHKNGILDKGMYRILKDWYEFLDETMHIQQDLIVYLRTTPEIVYERMRQRARSEEDCVSLQYLKELHELHEDWIMKNRVGHNPKVIVLDANVSLDKIGKEYKRFEEYITPTLQPKTAGKVAV